MRCCNDPRELSPVVRSQVPEMRAGVEAQGTGAPWRRWWDVGSTCWVCKETLNPDELLAVSSNQLALGGAGHPSRASKSPDVKASKMTDIRKPVNIFASLSLSARHTASCPPWGCKKRGSADHTLLLPPDSWPCRFPACSLCSCLGQACPPQWFSLVFSEQHGPWL